MLDIVYFSNVSRTTHRLVEKLATPANLVRIPTQGVFEDVAPQQYVLVVPTYGDSKGRRHIPHQVIRFLNIEANRAGCVGVIGTGNRNFGRFFAQAGRDVAAKLRVPVLHELELAGSSQDIDLIDERLTALAHERDHIRTGSGILLAA